MTKPDMPKKINSIARELLGLEKDRTRFENMLNEIELLCLFEFPVDTKMFRFYETKVRTLVWNIFKKAGFTDKYRQEIDTMRTRLRDKHGQDQDNPEQEYLSGWVAATNRERRLTRKQSQRTNPDRDMTSATLDDFTWSLTGSNAPGPQGQTQVPLASVEQLPIVSSSHQVSGDTTEPSAPQLPGPASPANSTTKRRREEGGDDNNSNDNDDHTGEARSDGLPDPKRRQSTLPHRTPPPGPRFMRWPGLRDIDWQELVLRFVGRGQCKGTKNVPFFRVCNVSTPSAGEVDVKVDIKAFSLKLLEGRLAKGALSSYAPLEDMYVRIQGRDGQPAPMDEDEFTTLLMAWSRSKERERNPQEAVFELWPDDTSWRVKDESNTELDLPSTPAGRNPTSARPESRNVDAASPLVQLINEGNLQERVDDDVAMEDAAVPSVEKDNLGEVLTTAPPSKHNLGGTKPDGHVDKGDVVNSSNTEFANSQIPAFQDSTVPGSPDVVFTDPTSTSEHLQSPAGGMNTADQGHVNPPSNSQGPLASSTSDRVAVTDHVPDFENVEAKLNEELNTMCAEELGEMPASSSNLANMAKDALEMTSSTFTPQSHSARDTALASQELSTSFPAQAATEEEIETEPLVQPGGVSDTQTVSRPQVSGNVYFDSEARARRTIDPKVFDSIEKAWEQRKIMDGQDDNSALLRNTVVGPIVLYKDRPVDEGTRMKIRELLKYDRDNGTQEFDKFAGFLTEDTDIESHAQHWNRDIMEKIAFYLRYDDIADMVAHPRSTYILPLKYMKEGSNPQWYQVIEAMRLLLACQEQNLGLEATLMGLGKTWIVTALFVIALVMRAIEEHYYRAVHDPNNNDIATTKTWHLSPDSTLKECPTMRRIRQTNPSFERFRCYCEYAHDDRVHPRLQGHHGQAMFLADPRSYKESIRSHFINNLKLHSQWIDKDDILPSFKLSQDLWLPTIALVEEYKGMSSNAFQRLHAKRFRNWQDRTWSIDPRYNAYTVQTGPVEFSAVLVLSTSPTLVKRISDPKKVGDTVFANRTGLYMGDEAHKFCASNSAVSVYNKPSQRQQHADAFWGHAMIVAMSGSTLDWNCMEKMNVYFKAGEQLAEGCGNSWSGNTLTPELGRYTQSRLLEKVVEYNAEKQSFTEDAEGFNNSQIGQFYRELISRFVFRLDFQSNLWGYKVAEERAEDVDVLVEYSTELLEKANSSFTQRVKRTIADRILAGFKVESAKEKEEIAKQVKAKMRANRIKGVHTFFPKCGEVLQVWKADVVKEMKEQGVKLEVGPPEIRNNGLHDLSLDKFNKEMMFGYTQTNMQEWGMFESKRNLMHNQNPLFGKKGKYLRQWISESPVIDYVWATMLAIRQLHGQESTRRKVLISVPDGVTATMIYLWYTALVSDEDSDWYIPEMGRMLLFLNNTHESPQKRADEFESFLADPDDTEDYPDQPQLCVSTVDLIAEGYNFHRVKYHFMIGEVSDLKKHWQRMYRNVRVSNLENGIRIFFITNTERDQTIRKSRDNEAAWSDFITGKIDEDELAQWAKERDQKLADKKKKAAVKRRTAPAMAREKSPEDV